MLLFIPFYISVYLYHNDKDKRIYFAIYLFKFVKILDGYTTRRKLGGIYIHLFKDKAYVLDINTLKRLEGGSHNFISAITYKNLMNTNIYSPFYLTNKQINATTVGQDLITQLVAKGWKTN